jgi:haloalkane dehalogenase
MLNQGKFIDIDGTKMHYVEVGEGDPILFLHGIPTSSYVWRKVIPHLSSLGRCFAPDLIGFGKSAKPDIHYSVEEHIHFITRFIEKLNLKKLTIVMHGWGSLIGLHYAMEHEKNCKGLVLYESFLRPLNNADMALPFQEQLLNLQEQENSPGLAANGINFVDQLITQSMMRELSDEDLEQYRYPFLQGSSQPILQYLNELPNGDGESQADKIIAEYSVKLMRSNLPKLLLYSVPGFITTIATVMWAKENLPNLEIVEIGEELHFAQESNPDLIGEAISVWLQGVEQSCY